MKFYKTYNLKPIISVDVIRQDGDYYYYQDSFNYKRERRFKLNENINNVVYHKSYDDAKIYLIKEIELKLSALNSSKLKLESLLNSL